MPVNTGHMQSSHLPGIIFRTIMPHEYSHLAEFLYEAVFIPEGKARPGREILNIPEIARYISDFGSENDHCLVAESADGLLGAVWTRVFSQSERGFGYIDEKTPELSMSVLPGYRNSGIGTSLLREMIGKLKKLGYEQVSLSVDLENFAFRLYQKFGFTVVGVSDGSATMVKNL